MNRLDLQAISRLRAREAHVLLQNEHYAGSYYLMGYAVECAIKSAIAKNVERHSFPDKDVAVRSYSHDFETLAKLASIWPRLVAERKVNRSFDENWDVVKDWREVSRYVATTSEAAARNMYAACTARRNGVLPWLRKQW
jgi:AbiV family abortive infection protein